MSLLCFVLVVYGLCFLASDARVFGLDTKQYIDAHDEGLDHQEIRDAVGSVGVVSVRPFFLKSRIIREHLSCYFCMGVWAGPLAHYIMFQTHRYVGLDHFLHHDGTVVAWVWSMVVAVLIGSVGSYVVENVMLKIEGAG